MEVKLGEKYRDSITGWEGVAVGRYEYLHGCVRVGLEGNKDGEPKEFVFDEQRLETLESVPVKSRATAGGPRDCSPPE